MEQAQFRIRLSVGTKLLISMVMLLVIVIVTLNLSAIFVLTNDKRDTVYQLQTTDVTVVGKDFVSLSQKQLETLRLALAGLDPTKPEQWNEKKNALQNIIDNQNDLVLLRMEKFDLKKKTIDSIFEVSRSDLLAKLETKPEQIKIREQMLEPVLLAVEKQSFAFVNATEVGTPPLLGSLVADLKVQVSDGVYLGAVGYVSLKNLTQNPQTQITVADRQGWVLFDSVSTLQYERMNIKNDPQFNGAVTTPLSSGTLEFKTDNARYLGSFYRPGLDVVVLGKTEWDYAMRSAYALVERFILIGVIAIGAAIIFALFFSKTMTAPLQKIFEATKAVAQGNFNINLKVTTRDEIGALSQSFNAMSKQIVGLIDEKLKAAHLENELAIASTVQQTLIPKSFIETEHLRIHSMYRSASQCGGDWWGYFTVGHYACFAIADATGHGFPSALITASMKSCYSVLEMFLQENAGKNISASEMVGYANRAVYESAKGQIMMTLFLSVLDLRTGTMKFASAGHNPPWLFQKKEEGGFNFKSLVASGQRLGETYDVPVYEEKEIRFSTGDIFFLFTDGLIEGKNTAGDQYTKKKALKKVQELVTLGTEEIISGISFEVDDYNKGKELDDDVTLAAIELIKIG